MKVICLYALPMYICSRYVYVCLKFENLEDGGQQDNDHSIAKARYHVFYCYCIRSMIGICFTYIS